MTKDIHRADAHDFAFDAVNALYAHIDKTDITPAVLPQWIAGCDYLNHYWNREEPEHQAPRRLAYVWLLGAMIASPEAVTAALKSVRDRLVDSHEELQPYAPDEEEPIAA